MMLQQQRIKQRIIHPAEPAQVDKASELLAGMTGVIDATSCQKGVRVRYQLQQTGFEDLLATLDSRAIAVNRHGWRRYLIAMVTLFERHERDNLLSRAGFQQRRRDIHVASHEHLLKRKD